MRAAVEARDDDEVWPAAFIPAFGSLASMAPLPPPHPVYLALGSNVGDKEAYLRAAVEALDAHVALRFRTASPIYRTAPQYVVEQETFLNAVVAFESFLDPARLLVAVKDIEDALGRRPRQRYGPREIDIDLLVMPGHAVASEALTLPHPRIAERAFVLRPLADLAPDLVATPEGETVAALLARLTDAATAGPEGSPSIEIHPTEPLHPRAGDWSDRVSPSAEATERLGGELAARCQGGEVFAVCGDLGAGKTCLARGFARGLGIRQPIQSPTFTLCRSYAGETLRFHHWDFYRLGDSEEVEAAGFDDSVGDPDAVTLVEWADRIPDLWTFAHEKIWMTTVDDDTRRLAIRSPRRPLREDAP